MWYDTNRRDGRQGVVSAWWLLLAFVVGGYCGILLMALLAIARDSDSDGGRGPRRGHRTGTRTRGEIDSNRDWSI